MIISDLLSPTDVMFDVRAPNKRLLLQELAAKAASSLGLGVDQVAPYLLKREGLGSTGIGGGVAIPHARLPDLQRPFGLMAKLKVPIEFDAMTGKPWILCLCSWCLRTRRTDSLVRLPWWPGRSDRQRFAIDCVVQKMPLDSIQ